MRAPEPMAAPEPAPPPSVRQYLQDLGIAPSQIEIVSYGKEKPFCAEHSEACWQQNRRVHFVLR